MSENKIIIGFSRPRYSKFNLFSRFFSFLIRLFERSEFSHVYIKWYSNKLNRYLIYHASATGVNFIGQEIFNQKSIVIHEFEIESDEDTLNKTKQFAIDNCGKSYGFLNLIGIGIVRIFYIFGINFKNFLSDSDKTFICSELVAKILKENFNFDIKKSLELIGPKEIYIILSNDERAKKLN